MMLTHPEATKAWHVHSHLNSELWMRPSYQSIYGAWEWQ